MKHRKNYIKEEKGTTSIEYAIIAILISIAIIAAVRMVSGSVQDLYLTISDAILNAI
jgi:Flp pilus assembly pilin Flp